MSDTRNQTPKSPSEANYSSAVARAVEWLGDRYLLAKPINARVRHESRAAVRYSRWAA